MALYCTDRFGKQWFLNVEKDLQRQQNFNENSMQIVSYKAEDERSSTEHEC